jgi:4-amino-4-deoxy-L-arabinose transferase-like glycosyltransferase
MNRSETIEVSLSDSSSRDSRFSISTPAVISLILVAAIWIYFLFFLPTFDLDESLYRRVAEEMKRSHLWWTPKWDGDVLFHKPPILYWLIAGISNVVDGSTQAVSIFSARLPSVLSCVGIMMFLQRTAARWRFKNTWIAPLAFTMGIFPMVTSASVIFDVLQTLCFMPALLLSAQYFMNARAQDPEFSVPALRTRDWIFWVLSLFLATAVKGLNGLVVPSFAFFLQMILFSRVQLQNRFRFFISECLAYGFKVFLPATFLSFLYYWFLDHKMGPAFTHEFFWVQHFGRSSEAMEAHGGSFLYHPISVFFGAGLLAPVLIWAWSRAKLKYSQYGFPLTYVFAFLFVFGFSATKLPHYTWPVWPALALALGIAFQKLKTQSLGDSRGFSRSEGFFASFPVLFLGALSLFLMLTPLAMIQPFASGDRLQLVLPIVTEIHWWQRVAFAITTLACFIFLSQKNTWVKKPEWLSVLALIASFTLAIGLTPSIQAFMVDPFYEIADSLKALHPAPTDCIRYNGPHSPTFSLALGMELTHNRCESMYAKYIIAPAWRVSECKERHFEVVSTSRYLSLCVKK